MFEYRRINKYATKLGLLAATTPRQRRKFSKNFVRCKNGRKNSSKKNVIADESYWLD